MRISDWSSDVCSSDLGALRPEQQDVARPELEIGERRRARGRQQDDTLPADLRPYAKGVPLGVPPDVGAHRIIHARERKSVVKGKSVSVRVDLGGLRILKKKNTRNPR